MLVYFTQQNRRKRKEKTMPQNTHNKTHKKHKKTQVYNTKKTNLKPIKNFLFYDTSHTQNNIIHFLNRPYRFVDLYCIEIINKHDRLLKYATHRKY